MKKALIKSINLLVFHIQLLSTNNLFIVTHTTLKLIYWNNGFLFDNCLYITKFQFS